MLVRAAFMFFTMSIVGSASALAQSLDDRVSVRNWSEFANGFFMQTAPACPMVNMELQYRLDNNAFPDKRISRADLVAIIGRDADYVAVEGGRFFYSLKTERYMEIAHAFAEMQGIDTSDPSLAKDPDRMMALQTVMQSFTPDQIPGDVPVLCGNGQTEVTLNKLGREADKRMRAERLEYLRTCELCRMNAGELLQAIYDGDYDKQYTFSDLYIHSLLLAGGRGTAALGQVLGGTAGAVDLSVIEEMIGAYMLSASRNWGEQCFGQGSFTREFEKTYKGASYQTLGGVYLGSDPDVVKITKYRVRGKFREACDRLCNRNGAMLMASEMGLITTGRRGGIGQIYAGIDDLVKSQKCNGQIIEQFEDNLLAMWAREQAEPEVERNALSKLLK